MKNLKEKLWDDSFEIAAFERDRQEVYFAQPNNLWENFDSLVIFYQIACAFHWHLSFVEHVRKHHTITHIDQVFDFIVK